MVNDAENLSQTDSNLERNEEESSGANERLNTGNQEVAAPHEKDDEKNDKDRNFARLREERERAERERDEYARRLREIEQEKKMKEQEEHAEKSEFNFGADDDLAEIRHLKAIAERQKKLEEQLKKYQQESNQMTAEARLKAQYNDLEKVVSDNNLSRLRAEDPDLVASLQSNPDTYTRYAAAYKAIKRMGIYQEDNYEQERKRAQDNVSKPRPLASVSPQQGNSPLSRANAFANGLTPELRKNLIKEMESARKKY